MKILWVGNLKFNLDELNFQSFVVFHKEILNFEKPKNKKEQW